MLNPQERKEILQNTPDLKRRDAFRQTLLKNSMRSFDTYIKFLNNLQKIFSQNSLSEQNFSNRLFKL